MLIGILKKERFFAATRAPDIVLIVIPDNFKAFVNILLHQKADGTFEDASVKSKIAENKSKALGVAFADFDGDGWTDIFVANDNVEQQLFRNQGDGTFEETALIAGVAFDEKGRRFAGMGIDTADYDGDGKQDVDHHRAIKRNLSALPQYRRFGFSITSHSRAAWRRSRFSARVGG